MSLTTLKMETDLLEDVRRKANERNKNEKIGSFAESVRRALNYYVSNERIKIDPEVVSKVKTIIQNKNKRAGKIDKKAAVNKALLEFVIQNHKFLEVFVNDDNAK